MGLSKNSVPVNPPDYDILYISSTGKIDIWEHISGT
jgi:hypothetical protein